MIIVDVYVPLPDTTFDFEAPPECTVGEFTEEVLRILCDIYHSESIAPGEFVLFAAEQGLPLPRERSLESCGIHSGSRLIIT
ncbi:MAG: EsaB/YukD family protein [Blautia sp.]|nr:EsaB/YukD family protein [Blautia sp.]